MANKDKFWITQEVECDICIYSWVAVYYKDCKELVCPNCGYLTKI